MAEMRRMKAGRASGVLTANVRFSKNERPFNRADLLFSGVNHSGLSYEVRVFLNNPDATSETPRDVAHGYAGRYSIFGHGGCFGDEGHCDVPPPHADPTDLRPPHQLTPQMTTVTITEALQHVLAEDRNGLRTVTLVPVSKAPRQADRAKTAPEWHFDSVHLETYLADVEPAIA
jgi:hypothetical protein